MISPLPTVRSLFQEALDLPAAERGAVLDQACQTAPELRGAVEDLLAAAFPETVGCLENHHGDVVIPDQPLVRQTMHDCLTEAMDVDRWLELLDRIKSHEVTLHPIETREPSPFSHQLLNAQPYAFLDDAPLEERRTRAVSTRRSLAIEEVPVRIQAQDDFRLRDVELRYSVNGGDWQKVRVSGGAKQSDSESLLRLEEIGAEHTASEQRLVPGDLVSYYAVAKDRRQSAQTDLFMVQVQPFERRFTQAQGGNGGGGGMADEQGAMAALSQQSAREQAGTTSLGALLRAKLDNQDK